MCKVFGYARASTMDQDLDVQLQALKEFGCDRIFQDKISNIVTHRPSLDEIVPILGEGDTLVVARFCRLGRSRDHVISLINELADRKVIFKALDIGIDSTTPTGKLVISIFASLAEYDHEVTMEKAKAGQILAREKGKHIGRPKGVNEENYDKVKKGFQRGLSVSEIVSLTGISESSVKRYRKRFEALAPRERR
jgi:DNA invertase Pin-like site-specific DNA recombinase